MSNSARWLILLDLFVICFVGTFLYICFTVRFSYFQGKPIGAVNPFTTWNYPHQPAAASLFVNFVYLPVLMDTKSDINKDVNSAKMSESFAIAEVLI